MRQYRLVRPIVPLLTLVPLVALAPFVTLVLLPVPGASQEVGVSVGAARSEYRELASPVSLGVQAGLPVLGWLHARADYRRYTDEQRWTRSTCEGLVAPGASCSLSA